MARALSLSQLFSTKHRILDFEPELEQHFGKPERKGVWFFMAPVGSGKTTFIAMLCKKLTKYGRVAYDSLEEGDSLSLKRAFKRAGLTPGVRKFIILDKEYYHELCERLDKRKSPDIVVIDTIQHSDLTKAYYLQLKKRYPNKTFIFISHMDGKKPEGKLAEFIYQDAGVKGLIEGFVVFIKSRYLDVAPKPFVIYEKRAKEYHGIDFIENFKNV